MHQNSSCMERTVVDLDSSTGQGSMAATSFHMVFAQNLWSIGQPNHVALSTLQIGGGRTQSMLALRLRLLLTCSEFICYLNVFQDQEFLMVGCQCVHPGCSAQVECQMVAGVEQVVAAIGPSFGLDTTEASSFGTAFMAYLAFRT